MRPSETIIKHINEAIKLASDLSQNEKDKYAKCVDALFVAKETLYEDLSAECKCDCHTGGSLHFMPCGCYRGNPVQ
jgi:hypothetical protein